MRQAVRFALFLILSGPQLTAAILVSVAPQTQTVPVGSTTQVQVSISGLGRKAAPSLGAYDLNLAFDPTILSFTGLSFGDPLLGDQLDPSGIGTISDFSNVPAGQLDFFEISLDQAAVLNNQQLDNFVLTTLHFTTISGGTSSLSLSSNSIGDSNGAPLNAALQSGRINVVNTPEPSYLAVLCLALVYLRWRDTKDLRRRLLSTQV